MRFVGLLAAQCVLAALGSAYADGQDALPTLPIINRALSLRDALTVAGLHSVTLQQANADAKTASAAAGSAQAPTKPSVSTTTYTTTGDSANILTTSPGVMPLNLFNVPPRGFADQNLMLMVPLFTGGKLDNAASAARRQSEAAELSARASQLTVTDTVTEAYAGAALQQALVDVAQARLTSEDEQVRVTQEKVTTGRLAPVDLLREQAEAAAARQALLASQNETGLALIRLKTALGVSQESQITLADTLDSLSTPFPLPASLQDALRQADTQRPELAAAQRRSAAADATAGAARSEYAPQVYGVAMADATAAQGGSRLGYTVGLTASLPLYDGGQRRADVAAAAAKRDRARADAQQARQTVDQEVATAWLTLQTATAQIQAAAAGVTASQQGYALADLRYNAGKSTTAERLDALSAFVRAQGVMAQAKADLITARVKLTVSVGAASPP